MPSGKHAGERIAGTFERIAMVIPLVWTATFLVRLRAGVPFTIAGCGGSGVTSTGSEP